MTIDGLVKALQEARNDIGGDTESRIHLTCNGNGDFVDILEVSNSKIFGFSIEVSEPWWVHKKASA